VVTPKGYRAWRQRAAQRSMLVSTGGTVSRGGSSRVVVGARVVLVVLPAALALPAAARDRPAVDEVELELELEPGLDPDVAEAVEGALAGTAGAARSRGAPGGCGPDPVGGPAGCRASGGGRSGSSELCGPPHRIIIAPTRARLTTSSPSSATADRWVKNAAAAGRSPIPA
jgi:hypothetical protein